jgi:hypothetical protein
VRRMRGKCHASRYGKKFENLLLGTHKTVSWLCLKEIMQ